MSEFDKQWTEYNNTKDRFETIHKNFNKIFLFPEVLLTLCSPIGPFIE